MAKNIIICLDGTGNQFGEENSNVVKLYRILEKKPQEQIAFYDPGVGTISDPGLRVPFGKNISRTLGFAFGYGLRKNIEEAYGYLMEYYEPGDQVYLFGFSRGAYTTRVLAGFIQLCGLLEKGCQNLFPYAYRLFSVADFKLCRQFKKSYARQCPIHFVGVWDTVSSIGWVGRRQTFPYTADNPLVATARHAVAIDERRTYYDTNLFKEEGKKSKTDVKQVWFAGVHSDVGGSYPEKESGLSKIALDWMIREAQIGGLIINPAAYDKICLGKGSKSYVGPDSSAPLHRSLSGVWWLLEYLPKNYTLKRRKFFFPRGRSRRIPENAIIHQTVFERIQALGKEYDPQNLPQNFEIEPQ